MSKPGLGVQWIGFGPGWSVKKNDVAQANQLYGIGPSKNYNI